MVQNQTERAIVLFELYPDIQKKAYDLAQDLRNIFEKQQIKLWTWKVG
jgi:hypothetical protein